MPENYNPKSWPQLLPSQVKVCYVCISFTFPSLVVLYLRPVTLKMYPLCLLSSQGTFIFSLAKYTPLKFSKTYVYPLWANIMGWFFATVSLSLIPLFVLYKMMQGEGTLKQVSMLSLSVMKNEKAKSYIGKLEFSSCWLADVYHYVVVCCSNCALHWCDKYVLLLSKQGFYKSCFDLLRGH